MVNVLRNMIDNGICDDICDNMLCVHIGNRLCDDLILSIDSLNDIVLRSCPMRSSIASVGARIDCGWSRRLGSTSRWLTSGWGLRKVRETSSAPNLLASVAGVRLGRLCPSKVARAEPSVGMPSQTIMRHVRGWTRLGPARRELTPRRSTQTTMRLRGRRRARRVELAAR